MMQPENNFFYYFMLVSAVQGAVLALSLLAKKDKSAANRLLALWLLLVVVDLVMSAAILKGFSQEYPDLMVVKYGWPFLHGPCLYLYARYLTTPERRRLADSWHFAPFILAKIIAIPFALMSNAEKLSYMALMRDNPPLMQKIISTILSFHGFAYVILAIFAVRNYRRKVLQFFSYKDNVYLSWLNTMLMINLAIWCLVVINRVVVQYRMQNSLDAYIYMGAALWIFAVGYFGFNQPEIFSGKVHAGEASVPGSARQGAGDTKPDEESFETVEKYAKTRISDAKKEEIRERLLAYMAEKPWLENTLTIKDISNNTGFPIHHISQVINDVFGENLFSFINKYRLAEAKQRLSDPKLQELNVLHIALDCGFNSKSSFNSIFKQHTGITPSEFRRQALVTPTSSKN